MSDDQYDPDCGALTADHACGECAPCEDQGWADDITRTLEAADLTEADLTDLRGMI
ncbi:hypothetical protein [Streptomyces uncialis]|uniref:hypothetical protein n=1 Tax=Streptomyces uncialis TaxID=1048205 RepID=UPI0033C341D5